MSNLKIIYKNSYFMKPIVVVYTSKLQKMKIL